MAAAEASTPQPAIRPQWPGRRIQSASADFCNSLRRKYGQRAEYTLVEMKWWSSYMGPAKIAQHLNRIFLRQGVSRVFISSTRFTQAALDMPGLPAAPATRALHPAGDRDPARTPGRFGRYHPGGQAAEATFPGNPEEAGRHLAIASPVLTAAPAPAATPRSCQSLAEPRLCDLNHGRFVQNGGAGA